MKFEATKKHFREKSLFSTPRPSTTPRTRHCDIHVVVVVPTHLFRRTLRCTRIAIHVHLFISLALNNLAWIVWYKTVVQDLTQVQQNGVSNKYVIVSPFYRRPLNGGPTTRLYRRRHVYSESLLSSSSFYYKSRRSFTAKRVFFYYYIFNFNFNASLLCAHFDDRRDRPYRPGNSFAVTRQTCRQEFSNKHPAERRWAYVRLSYGAVK